MTDIDKRWRKAAERNRKSDIPWKKSGFLDKAIKGIRGDIEVDIRDAVKKSTAEGTATLEGGTMWFPKGSWVTTGITTTSTTTSTTSFPYLGTPATGGIATGSGFYGGVATGKIRTYASGYWSSSTPWIVFDDLTEEQRDMVREVILDQI